MSSKEKKELKTYIHKLYIVDSSTGTVKLKNKKCPRCGSIMAHHVQPLERWHCGKCNYTEFVVSRPAARPAPTKGRKK